MTIQGILIPVSWDPSGSPTALAVAAFDENEYWLVHDDLVARWFASIGQSVIVEGRPIEKENKILFEVESIKPVEIFSSTCVPLDVQKKGSVNENYQ